MNLYFKVSSITANELFLAELSQFCKNSVFPGL